MLLAAKKVLQQFSPESFPPASLFFGEEAYLIHRTARKACELMAGDPPTAPVRKLEGRDTDVRDLLQGLQAADLFSQREIIWLKEPTFLEGGKGATKFQEHFLAILEKGIAPGKSLVMSYTGSIDRRTKLGKSLQSLLVSCEFPALSQYDIGDPEKDQTFTLVAHELKLAGKAITLDAFRLLRERCPNDLWSVMTEVEKYIAYASERRDIDVDMVEELTPPTRQDGVFDLLDAVGRRSREEALQRLDNLFLNGETEVALHMSLTNSVHNLLALHTAKKLLPPGLSRLNISYFDVKKQFKNVQELLGTAPPEIQSLIPLGHPFAFYRTLQQLPRFTARQLYQALRELHTIDLQLKTTGVSGRILLERFVIQFCGEAHA